MLQPYNYTLKHKSGKDNNYADGLSRRPLPYMPRATPVSEDIVNLVNAKNIKEGTSRDPVLAKVRHYELIGWPNEGTPEIMPFYNRKDELSMEDVCILWGCSPPEQAGPDHGRVT